MSRQIRQKVSYPGNITEADLGGHPGFHRNFPNYPNQDDGDGRPGGAGPIDPALVSVVGNDDATANDEINQPYTEHVFPAFTVQVGELFSIDAPRNVILNTVGDNGDTVEYRMHFREFARLKIGDHWCRISDYYPWRAHHKFRKQGGNWIDAGSDQATDNAGF
jgi:hypothetical protein